MMHSPKLSRYSVVLFATAAVMALGRPGPAPHPESQPEAEAAPAAEDAPKPLAVGETIPAFRANDQNGELWDLKDHLGQKKYLVVYFYPAAMTGGCTAQACAYRDSADALKGLDVEVVGVSGDSVRGLKAFETAEGLNFTLLSDVNGVIAERLGVPTRDGGSITKTVGGQEITLLRSLSASRWTYIFDREGKLLHIDSDVKAGQDSAKTVEFLTALEAKKE